MYHLSDTMHLPLSMNNVNLIKLQVIRKKQLFFRLEFIEKLKLTFYGKIKVNFL